uniref:Uncharacterized protein n=1 Tax=Myxococcus fulvus TaxID=33 RepID=B0YR12_MYXFU|nr:hypothetical protein pMF1.3 [Myxococcus fulvus]
MADEKKQENAESWGKNAMIFGAGMVTGSTLTVVAGHFWPKVPVPPALANALGADAAKK